MTSSLPDSYIDSQPAFADFCERLKSAPRLALDTEFERSSTYYPILALMQIASEDESALIDPLAIDDWGPFIDLLQSDTLIVMHSCSEDLEVFRKHFGVQPEQLMDTQIACAFAGKGDALGYANMVLALRGVELDKSETRSNWLQRPLTEAQKQYALEDVRWLLGIHAELDAELHAAGRLAWVQQECDNLRDKYLSEPGPEQQWLRIKGLGRADPRAWPMAYALSDWREQLCRRLDKPRGWIMKDPELLEIATRRPRNQEQLAAIRGVSVNTLKRNSRAVLEITNAESLPEPPNRPVPELEPGQRGLLKRLQQVVNDRAEQEGMSARFIANKLDLTELIQHQTGRADLTSSLFKGWRYDLVGRDLEALVEQGDDNGG